MFLFSNFPAHSWDSATFSAHSLSSPTFPAHSLGSATLTELNTVIFLLSLCRFVNLLFILHLYARLTQWQCASSTLKERFINAWCDFSQDTLISNTGHSATQLPFSLKVHSSKISPFPICYEYQCQNLSGWSRLFLLLSKVHSLVSAAMSHLRRDSYVHDGVFLYLSS